MVKLTLFMLLFLVPLSLPFLVLLYTVWLRIDFFDLFNDSCRYPLASFGNLYLTLEEYTGIGLFSNLIVVLSISEICDLINVSLIS